MSVLLLVVMCCGVQSSIANGPEDKAVRFLAREVPGWSVENHCFSCHNNGDAARALYAARALGYEVPAASITDTTCWLESPLKWEKNGGDGPISDKLLARIQFSAALAAALESRSGTDRGALILAAERVAADQNSAGFWKIEGDDAIGSPTTYGKTLATVMARNTLQRADSIRFRSSVDRADRWLNALQPRSVVDAAALLLVERSADAIDRARLKSCLDLIRDAQAENGGWGPYRTSPPEVFDTALVLIALGRLADSPEIRGLRRRGRTYLVDAQNADGGWPETTRPPGGQSYAQRLSTTGWATMALLATKGLAP